MGSDVAPVLADAQRRNAPNSDFSGSGYEGGAGPIRFAPANEHARAERELQIYSVGETSDFRFTLLGDKPVHRRPASTARLAQKADLVGSLKSL